MSGLAERVMEAVFRRLPHLEIVDLEVSVFLDKSLPGPAVASARAMVGGELGIWIARCSNGAPEITESLLLEGLADSIVANPQGISAGSSRIDIKDAD